MSELDANIIVDGQKVIAVQAQEGTVVKDGGAIDATSVIETASGKQKVVKVMQVGGGGGGGPTPTPTVNWYTGNTGTTITILDTSSANFVEIYKNGVLLQLIEDYSISGTTLTLTTALEATDKICVKVDDTSSADLQAIQTLLSEI